MSSTPDGVVLRWPDTDLPAALSDVGDSRTVSAILREIPENPSQKWQDLTSEDTINVLVDGSGSSGSHDPKLKLYVGASGTAAGRAPGGDAELANRL